jgi:FAD/FMN-containing dehydrogenase
MTTGTLTSTARFDALRALLPERIVERDDPGWAVATRAFDLTVVQQPAAVATPRSDAEVVAIVDFAREHGLQVAPQRTGHNARPLGSLEDAILLRTDLLQGVEIDRDRRVARIGGGARWADVLPAASAAGLAAPHGTTADVSVAGYTLGGGVGWYGRKHGLAANSVVAIELVPADGRLRRVDRDHDPEVFWALRGGGGNFGVVTSLEIALLPISEVYAGVLLFPWERAAEVLHAWRDWTATAPDEVTSVGRIVQVPPFEHIPAAVRGRPFAMVDAVVIGDEALGREVMAPLWALGPEIDTFAMRPPAGIADLHMDPEEPVPATTGCMMLGDLTPEAIDRFVAAVGPGSGSRLLVADLRHVGGALGRPAPGHGALAALDASYLSFAVGLAATDGMERASRERLDTLGAALAPWDTGRRYLNFSEERTEPARFFAPAVEEQLRAVKAAVDPGDLFRANHRIAPAG